MTRLLIVLLLPLALAGCVTKQEAALPMALGPSDTATAGCLQFGDAPTIDGCQSARPSAAK